MRKIFFYICCYLCFINSNLMAKETQTTNFHMDVLVVPTDDDINKILSSISRDHYDISDDENSAYINMNRDNILNLIEGKIVYQDDKDVIDKEKANFTMPDKDNNKNIKIYYKLKSDEPFYKEIKKPGINFSISGQLTDETFKGNIIEDVSNISMEPYTKGYDTLKIAEEKLKKEKKTDDDPENDDDDDDESIQNKAKTPCLTNPDKCKNEDTRDILVTKNNVKKIPINIDFGASILLLNKHLGKQYAILLTPSQKDDDDNDN